MEKIEKDKVIQSRKSKVKARGKPHGKLIWKSIQNGPTPHPQTTDLAPEGGAVPPPRNKRDEEFTAEDSKNELEALFDEFEYFHANGNELIQDYFVCFHKLVNDMKVTQLDIPTHQLNPKIANNLPSYWGKYLTHAKNYMNMSTVTYVELFTHLRTYKEHALKSLKKKEQSSVVVDPLAYLAKTKLTHSTTLPVTRRASSNTGTKGIQTTGSGVNNSGKKWYHDKALLMQAKEKGTMLDAEAEAFLADVEYTAPYDQPLALTTTNLFKANHEDAYDSDVNEGPHASAAFMANLSSTAELKRCKIEMQALECNKVKHDLDMAIVERNKRNSELEEKNVILKSTLKSKVVSIENLQQESKQVLSEKKTLEDKYLEEIVVLTNANKVATNVLKGFQMPTHTIPMLSKRPNFAPHDLHKTSLGYSSPIEESLVHAEVYKIKMAERPGHALPINYAKLNAMYDQFVPHKEFFREQVYWLSAAEIASQSSTPAKPVAPFVHTRPVKSDVHKK
nr:hypothetical protein [Tanacetum cinerariifolium]